MANRSSETSRQRRARENRARRAALEARTKAAQVPREQRVKQQPSATSGASGAHGGKRSGKGAERSTGGARQAMGEGRLGQVPVEVDALEGSFLGKLVHVPGGMQVIMAAVLVLVLTGMGLFMDTVPPEGAEAGAKATRTLLDAYGPSAVLFLAPPVILVGNALFFSLHERRRRMWIISAVMMVIFSALMLQFVFPAAFLAYAAWRSKRIEDGPARRAPTSSEDDRESDVAVSADGSSTNEQVDGELDDRR